MKTHQKNWFVYACGLVVCLCIRLLPFRPPNIEPILATQMPFSKAYGSLAAFFFALTSIIAFDALTRTLGIWTLCVGLTYALIGLWAGVYFKTRKNTIRNYALFAVMSTLVFDAVTGLGIGPLFFHQSFMVAFIGQIPFTAAHLLGNVGFAILISPALYTLASKEPSTLWRYTFISISNNNI